MRIVLAFLGCLMGVSGYGQVLELGINAQGIREIELNADFSSLSVHGVENMNRATLQIGTEKFNLSQNEHFSGLVSNLIVPERSANRLTWNCEECEGKALLKFYGVNGIDEIDLGFSNKKDCEKPVNVDQDVWRKGLDDPKPNPEETDVEHVIIHHSATSNSASDYNQVVRDIYSYHTGGNGWDDVGYNFLIAPDGTLYAGRDGQGKEDDVIKGAHFCAKNGNTMGVCLIGTYTDEVPSDTMLGTLNALLAWKLKKEQLQPYETLFHPKGASDGYELPIIAGHRDGCSTECPGAETYGLIETIREGVAQILIDCGYEVGLAERVEQPTIQYGPNGIGISSEMPMESAQILDLSGRVLQERRGAGIYHVHFQDQPTGLYLLHLQLVDGKTHTSKMLVP